jgi:dTMP kinase
MHNAKLIVCAGLDGSGKSTQMELIKEDFEKTGVKYKYIHFPIYGDNEASNVIAAYLRGEYGNISEVNPVFVANMYAMDRYLYLPKLRKYMLEYDVVLLDRYVFCNMAFQGAKYDNETQSKILREWIYDYEYNFLELPYPDLTIFFDVPMNIIKERLTSKRQGSDRTYLNGKEDIHEADLNFQEKVRYNYLQLKEYSGYNIINCVNDDKILTPQELFNSYINLVYDELVKTDISLTD